MVKVEFLSMKRNIYSGMLTEEKDTFQCLKEMEKQYGIKND